MDSAGDVLEALRQYAASAPGSAGLDVAPESAAGELIALGKAVSVLDAALGAAMVRYDRLGAGSPAAILVQHAGLTRTHATNLRKLGRKLDTDLPATRERLTAGQIGTAQARSIIDLDEELANADTPVPQAARRQVETALADACTLAHHITTTPDNDTPTNPPTANDTPAAGRALTDGGAPQESCNDPGPARSAGSVGSPTPPTPLTINAPKHWPLRPPPMTSPPPHTRQPRLPRAA